MLKRMDFKDNEYEGIKIVKLDENIDEQRHYLVNLLSEKEHPDIMDACKNFLSNSKYCNATSYIIKDIEEDKAIGFATVMYEVYGELAVLFNYTFDAKHRKQIQCYEVKILELIKNMIFNNIPATRIVLDLDEKGGCPEASARAAGFIEDSELLSRYKAEADGECDEHIIIPFSIFNPHINSLSSNGKSKNYIK